MMQIRPRPIERISGRPIDLMKGVEWEDLTPASKEWALEWVRDFCWSISYNPSGTPAQREQQVQVCYERETRDKNKLAQNANRWQCDVLVAEIIGYEEALFEEREETEARPSEGTVELFSELVKGGMALQLHGCYWEKVARLIKAGYLDKEGNILQRPEPA